MSKKTASKNYKKTAKIFGSGSKLLIASFLLGLALGYGIDEFNGIGVWYSKNIETQNINVCFTPPAGCGFLIAGEIARANKTIYVQAFDFTSEIIAKELVKAFKRGVMVKVLVDRMSKDSQYSMVSHLEKAGIEVTIDKVSGLAHNKVMIIDNRKVITGSFNFTKGADKRNAENVVLIEDEDIAYRYTKNWLYRRANSI